MNENYIRFHLPTKPVTIVDAINRAACAIGSMRYAQLTETADYNGHAIHADYRPHAIGGARYVAEYFWAGRVVIARGDCEHVLRSAIEEFKRQGRGASLAVSVLPEHAEIARSLGLVEGDAPETYPTNDWRFAEVGHAAHLEKQYGVPATAYLLQATGSKEEWRTKVFADVAGRVRSAS